MLVAVAGAARRARTSSRPGRRPAAWTWPGSAPPRSAEEITDTAVTQPLVVAATLLAHRGADQARPAGRTQTSSWPATPSARSPPTRSPASSPPTTPSRWPPPAAPRWPRPARVEPTGMSAVLGGDEAEVLARLEELDLVAGQPQRRRPDRRRRPPRRAGEARRGPAGQGPGPPAGHRRRVPHRSSWRRRWTATPPRRRASRPPSRPPTLLSNADGQPVASAADAMSKLVAQLTRPVRWDLCTETLRQRNVTAIVEFPPAGTLVGIAKRELRGVADACRQVPRRPGRARRALEPAPPTRTTT